MAFKTSDMRWWSIMNSRNGKQNKVSSTIVAGTLLREILGWGVGMGTQVEPNGLPELAGSRWESGRPMDFTLKRKCTERELQRSSEVSLEYLSIHAFEETLWKWRKNYPKVKREQHKAVKRGQEECPFLLSSLEIMQFTGYQEVHLGRSYVNCREKLALG